MEGISEESGSGVCFCLSTDCAEAQIKLTLDPPSLLSCCSMSNDPLTKKIKLDAERGDTDEIGPNDLNEGQLQAFNRAVSGESLFITGGAGTGKSFVLQRIISALSASKRVFVTASTGLAASQYEGGRTIHSLLGNYSPLKNVKEESFTIVVDEVGMVAASLLDDLAKMVARVKSDMGNTSRAKSSKAKTSNAWPSSVQLICVGDFLQLPPIDAKCAFESKTWNDLKLRGNTLILSQSRRQNDVKFVSLLNRLRVGICTSEDVETLNRSEVNNHEDSTTHLYAYNTDANDENQRRTKGEFGEIKSYALSTTDGNTLPLILKQVLGKKKKKSIFHEELKLGVGYVVMVTTNVDVEAGIVNGLRGIVTRLADGDDDCISIQCGERIFEINRHTVQWKKSPASVTQFPLCLAWAITFHKAQGLTLDKGLVDLKGVFAFGQVYTALSRFRSLEDVVIKGGLHSRFVWALPEALNYYQLGVINVPSLKVPKVNVPEIAVTDIVGDPCILRGRVAKLRKRYTFKLTCAVKPNAPSSSILFWWKGPIPECSNLELIQVSVNKFTRTHLNGFPNSKYESHTFFGSNVMVTKVTGCTSHFEEVFIHDSLDVELNIHSRVSFTGHVRKALSNRNVMTVKLLAGDEIEVRCPATALVQIPLQKGKEYEFSKIISGGVGHTLLMDAASSISPSIHVRKGRKDRCISVSGPIYALYLAGVFAEVLSSPRDVKGVWIHPLLLIADDDGFPSEDPFINAARDVHNKVNAFFCSVLEAVKGGWVAPDGAELVAPEIPAIRLGFGVDFNSKKYGVRPALAQTAATKLHELLGFCKKHQFDQTFSSQAQFLLLEIFCSGFGNDMMNDFFAYNMFVAIVKYTCKVAKDHYDLLVEEGLVVQEMRLRDVVSSFAPELFEDEQLLWSKWCENQPLADVKYSIPMKMDKPFLLLPRILVEMRSSCFLDRVSSLRISANELFRGKLQAANQFNEISSYFNKVEDTATISQAKLSIVVATKDIVESLASMTKGTRVTVGSGGYLVRLKVVGDSPILCVIGDVEWFSANPYAFRQLVLVFVEPVKMDPTAEFGCHQVIKIVDTTVNYNDETPFLRRLRSKGGQDQPSGIVLCSDILAKENRMAQNPRLLPNLPKGCSWGIDESQFQIGKFCRPWHEFHTCMMWAIKRQNDGAVNPVKCILDKLQELPLLGPKASFEQLLAETERCDRVFDDDSSIRIGTFNIKDFKFKNINSKDVLLVDEVIVKNRFAVLALQELQVPSRHVTSKESFAERVEKDRGNGTKLKVYVAKESTGLRGSTREFPSLIIDENLVVPAQGNWHGYFPSPSLVYDPNNFKDDYQRVPYFWSLKVKKSDSLFIVVSVHQPPTKGNSATSQRARAIFMKGVSKFVEEHWANDDVFIVGDFNVGKTEELRFPRFNSLLPCVKNTNLANSKQYDHILVRDITRFEGASKAVVVDLRKLVDELLVVEQAKGSSGSERATELQSLIDDRSKFEIRVSDHCPVYVEYTAWKSSRLIDPGSILMTSFE